VLAANIAGLLEPSRAVDVAARLPPEFLADVAIELDPRRATDVIAQIPPAQITAVTRELVAREEYVTMGRFVGHLPDPSVKAALSELDDRSLLRVGFVLEQKQRIDHVLGLLDPARYDGLIEAAGDGLWAQALDVLSYLGKTRRKKLVEIAIDKGAPVLESLVQAADQHDMWDAVLELEAVISPARRDGFIAFIDERHPELRPKLESRRRS
jgi:Mg/Co/Ni transporter MgtE